MSNFSDKDLTSVNESNERNLFKFCGLDFLKNDPFFENPDPPDILKALEQFQNIANQYPPFPSLFSPPRVSRLRGLNANSPDCSIFTSSSVMTYQKKNDEKPQIYQASTSKYQGPGGVGQSKKCVRDSRTGTEKLNLGYHLGERAHILEKRKNYQTGNIEEDEKLVNMNESDMKSFRKEWMDSLGNQSPLIQTRINRKKSLPQKEKFDLDITGHKIIPESIIK